MNSTGKRLLLDRNASSRALSEAAGAQMQDECTQIAAREIVSLWKIYKTKGYNLKCKEVFHVLVGRDLQVNKLLVSNVVS